MPHLLSCNNIPQTTITTLSHESGVLFLGGFVAKMGGFVAKMTRPSAPWPCFRIRNLVPLSRAESPSMYSRPGYMQWILQLYIKCRVHSTCILSAAPPEQDPPNAARCRRRDSRSCWSRSSSCIDRPVGIQVVRVWIQGVSVVMYANKESAPFNGFQRMPQHAEIEQNFSSTTAKKKNAAL